MNQTIIINGESYEIDIELYTRIMKYAKERNLTFDAAITALFESVTTAVSKHNSANNLEPVGADGEADCPVVLCDTSLLAAESQKVDAIAAALGVSRQDVIRLAVNQYANLA